MATNPMKRKARISFLLGVLVTLLVAAAIIAFLFIQLQQYQKKEQESIKASKQVYVLNQDVSSGQEITTDMYTILTVDSNLVPSNAVSDLSIIQNYSLTDKEGDEVYSKNSKLHIKKDNQEYELKKEEETDNYYIEKNNEKVYVELNNVALIAKVNMKANTVITKELIAKSDNKITDDVRKEEYNVFVLPMDLTTGDYVDVRLMLPNGQNYIVVSKKEVEIPNVAGTDVADTIWINAKEEEIITISSAIVDAARIEGSKLYVTKYTEAGIQKAAEATYVPTAQAANLITNNPNILEKSIEELKARYNRNSDFRNNYINSEVEKAGEEADTNVKTVIDESIKNTQDNRKKYLDSLSGTSVQ